MSKPILSVVRVRRNIDHGRFEDSWWANAGTISDKERRAHWETACKEWDAKGGKYVKSGGGAPTDNLQEAQVFGWSKRAQITLRGMAESRYYEVLPILLTIVEP